MQLAVADVERDHACGAALEQHVGEAAGRGADVEAVEPARVDARSGRARARACARPARRTAVRRTTLERRRLVDLLARPSRGRGTRPAITSAWACARLSASPRSTSSTSSRLRVTSVRAASPATISASTEVSASSSREARPRRARRPRRRARARLRLAHLAARSRRRRGCRRRPGRAARARPRRRARARARRRAARPPRARTSRRREKSAPVFSRCSSARSWPPSRSCCWPPIISSVASTSSRATSAPQRSASRSASASSASPARIAVASP